ncbi:MAG: ribosome maturation factor RimM, partial [Veillonella nakazawae]
IQVRREDLVELPEGRYYIFDMIGLEVQDTKGNVLGTLTDVLQPGANDVYVVSKEGEPDQLFAAIDDVIIDID